MRPIRRTRRQRNSQNRRQALLIIRIKISLIRRHNGTTRSTPFRRRSLNPLFLKRNNNTIRLRLILIIHTPVHLRRNTSRPPRTLTQKRNKIINLLSNNIRLLRVNRSSNQSRHNLTKVMVVRRHLKRLYLTYSLHRQHLIRTLFDGSLNNTFRSNTLLILRVLHPYPDRHSRFPRAIFHQAKRNQVNNHYHKRSPHDNTKMLVVP